MTFYTPRNLHSLAAKVFVEDFILESLVISELEEILNPRFEMKSTFDRDSCCLDKNGHKEEMLVFMDYLSKCLSGCNHRSIESILQVLRTTNHKCYLSVLILQYLFAKEVTFQKKHWSIFPFLLIMQRQYPNIEKLIIHGTEEVSSRRNIYDEFFRFIPRLKYFKAYIPGDINCLTALREHCGEMRDLTLVIRGTCFDSSELIRAFFSEKTLEEINDAYVKLKDVPLSFPHLQNFSINRIGPEQFAFFQMFVHYYPGVNLCIGLEYTFLSNGSVSWFDAVLSHNIVINPELSIKQCELNTRDLFLPFCEESLRVWNGLESLFICVGLQGKKTPATSTAIGKRLHYLLSKQPNVKELWIRVEGPISEDELDEIFYPTLNEYGKKFKQVGLLGILYFLSHRSLVKIINYCSNVKHLIIIGKRITKYLKGVKLKPLSHLENLTILWAESQSVFCQWVNKVTVDFIKQAPNLKVLTCTINIPLLTSLGKILFGVELVKLYLYFHTETNSDGLNNLRKILANLPKLEEIVVIAPQLSACKCNSTMQGVECFICEETDMCMLEYDSKIYENIKHLVDRTQIYVRFPNFEDDELCIFL